MHNKALTTMTTAAAALAAAVALSGCGSSESTEANSTPPAQTAPPAVQTDDTQSSHNQADVAFAQGMIPHHQQALEMSDILLSKQNIDERVARLAEEIRAAQRPEIETMHGWLRQWGASMAPDHEMGGMHGMMSEQDLAQLRDAQGTDASRLFLTQMIEHHEGAVTMAQNEIDKGQFTEAVALARDIITTQQKEIDRMREILQSL